MKARHDRAIVVLILVVGWALWLHRMGVNDHDDTVSNELLFARGPLTTLICCIPWSDQSPLYFLCLHVARLFGESPFAIQLLNALLLTATLVSTYLVARAFSDRPAVAFLALLFGTISPASLWLVRNGRMYSIQALLAVVSVLFVLRYLDKRRRRDLITLSILCVLNIYNHFVGFLITTILFATIFIVEWRDSRTAAKESGAFGDSRRTLLPVALAAVGIIVFTLPQLFRLAALMGGGVPLRPGQSLQGLSRGFFARVGWFWFMNTDWGSLRRGEAVLTVVYLGSVGLLAAGGLALARRSMAAIAGLSIGLPLIGLGLAAARLDVRDRYFVWTLPLLWIAIATGAAGPLTSSRLPVVAREALRGIRAALFLAVVTGSLWLLSNKLPERYPEWTKLMIALQQIHRPSMVTYMPPGPTPVTGSLTGIPQWIGSALGLPAELREVRELTGETRGQFLSEVAKEKDFVFLVHWTYANDELAWRDRYLEDHGYKKSLVSVWGAHAEVFTRREIEDFTRVDRTEANASQERIVTWVRQRLSGKPATPSHAPVLADAEVARVRGDGTIREGRVFASQRGESGLWKLGPLEWDLVEELRAPSGGAERDVILAHPETDSVLAVAFPALEMNKSLTFTYGIADSGLRFKSGADVRVAVYVNGSKKTETVCANTPGWKELALDTDALSGQAADVVLLIKTVDDRSRHFAFQLEASSRAAMPAPPEAEEASTGDVPLTGGQFLSASLASLKVRRVAGEKTIDAWRDPLAYSAADMHEAEGPDGIGVVRGRWALGPLLWDAVGLTRQRSGGEPRGGLWAHPKDGTTLVLEARNLTTERVLHGYYGLTDLAVAQATARGVSAPVQLKILIDGKVVLERSAARARGWHLFEAAMPAGPAKRMLRVEISSASDSWAHFIFDLWSGQS